jgi:hypothetical protein
MEQMGPAAKSLVSLHSLHATEDQSVVYDGQCKINLKIVMSTMIIQIPVPLFLPNITFDKKTQPGMCCVDHPVKFPAENSQVISIRANHH